MRVHISPPLRLLLRLPPPENISTALMASQKSGPVAVAVIGYLTSDTSTQGLMALPAVLGQLVQVGSPLACPADRQCSKAWAGCARTEFSRK